MSCCDLRGWLGGAGQFRTAWFCFLVAVWCRKADAITFFTPLHCLPEPHQDSWGGQRKVGRKGEAAVGSEEPVLPRITHPVGRPPLQKGVIKGANPREEGISPPSTSLLQKDADQSRFLFSRHGTWEASRQGCPCTQEVGDRLNYRDASFPYQSFWAPKYKSCLKKASGVQLRASMFTQASALQNKPGHPDLWALGLTRVHGNPSAPLNTKPWMGSFRVRRLGPALPARTNRSQSPHIF